MTGTNHRQGLTVATSAGPEAEVVTHGDPLGRQLAHQHLLHEGLGAEGGQLPAEGHQHQLLNAQRLQQMQLFSGQVEPQARLAVQHLAGMGPKAHHRGNRRRFLASRSSNRRDDAAMALMQAIKAAEGDGRGAQGLLGGSQGYQRYGTQRQREPNRSSHGTFGSPIWMAEWLTASTCS